MSKFKVGDVLKHRRHPETDYIVVDVEVNPGEVVVKYKFNGSWMAINVSEDYYDLKPKEPIKDVRWCNHATGAGTRSFRMDRFNTPITLFRDPDTGTVIDVKMGDLS